MDPAHSQTETPVQPQAPRISAQRLWPKLLLLVISLIVGILFCEIAARVLAVAASQTLAENQARRQAPNGSELTLGDIIIPSRNPRLIYELLPDRAGTMWGGIPYRANAFGMRGPKIAKDKPQGVFRIACLGDSTMFGWAVREEDAYVRVLERVLNSVGDKQRYEVLNFAVPGYGTALEAELFVSRASQFNPDLVVLQFDLNDLTLPVFVSEKPSLWTLRRSYLLPLFKGFASGEKARNFTALAAAKLLPGKTRKVQIEGVGMVDFAEARAEHAPPQFRHMVGWEGVLSSLDKIWAAARQPILHLSAHYPFGNSEAIPAGKVNLYEKKIRNAMKEDGQNRLHYADISHSGALLCDKYGLKLFEDLGVNYPEDSHPSLEWHILIARLVYLALVENRLLPENSAHYARSAQLAENLWREADRRWANRAALKSPSNK